MRAYVCTRVFFAASLVAGLWAAPAFTSDLASDCSALYAHAAAAHTLDLEHLESEIAARRARVPEFGFIRKEAEKRGLRVWLFGGTAAGYAHYVNWDLAREAGDLRFQKARFDYDYTNIYRSTQDLDIVVDGNQAQAKEFEETLKAQFPYFLGSKANAWEVRSLRDTSQDKGALLDDFGFMNQHTDSNSTGMIELTSPPHGEHVVRDLRDWKGEEDAQFLKDVRDGRISYYFSHTHEQTPRAKAGQNPAIFSIVRYLTKAFQYDLKMRPEDLAVIKREIADFNPGRDLANPDAHRWIEKNGKKLFQHAVNIEYAWNTLEELGLRQKLIGIRNNPSEQGSLAWWLSREPLRSKPLGTAGKTAKELGMDTVAHETSDFLAYESITRAHTGEPNVLISRAGKAGEAAVHGDGFYTKTGRQGARGTGITIRFQVDPNAREGVDFTLSIDNYVIWHNRSAIRVIPESLEMSPSQYFEFLSEGKKISAGDQALMWKLKRKLEHSVLWSLADPNEMKKIRLLVLEKMKTGGPNRDLLFNEWIKLEGPRAGINGDALIEAEKNYRVDPEPWIDGLIKISHGTELETWISQEWVPRLLAGLKPDLGEGATQRALLSKDPTLREFGVRALQAIEDKRASPLSRALRKIANDSDSPHAIARFLKGAAPADEKAALLEMQIGPNGNPASSFKDLLKLIPEIESPTVERALEKETALSLFKKLAQEQGKESEFLRSAAPESFQFKAFDFPKEGVTFEMGSPATEAGASIHESLRTVTLTKSFEMQATPVTQAQWELLMGENPSKFQGAADSANRPVEQISWDNLQKFVEKLNELDPHHTYRLPTEAEWEFAARAGTKTAYSFGDDPSELSDYAWHSGNSESQTHAVAGLKPNPAGLYDMHGNVWEWVQDRYSDSPGAGVDPTGPPSGSERVIRGGAWVVGAQTVRSGQRSKSLPGPRGSAFFGFRLVRTPK